MGRNRDIPGLPPPFAYGSEEDRLLREERVYDALRAAYVAIDNIAPGQLLPVPEDEEAESSPTAVALEWADLDPGTEGLIIPADGGEKRVGIGTLEDEHEAYWLTVGDISEDRGHVRIVGEAVNDGTPTNLRMTAGLESKAQLDISVGTSGVSLLAQIIPSFDTDLLLKGGGRANLFLGAGAEKDWKVRYDATNNGHLLAQGTQVFGLGSRPDPDPAGVSGYLYYNTTSDTIRAYVNGAWDNVVVGATLWSDGTGYIYPTNGATEDVVIGDTNAALTGYLLQVGGTTQTSKGRVAILSNSSSNDTAELAIDSNKGRLRIQSIGLTGIASIIFGDINAGGSGGLFFGTAGGADWEISTAGHWSPVGAKDIGQPATPVTEVYANAVYGGSGAALHLGAGAVPVWSLTAVGGHFVPDDDGTIDIGTTTKLVRELFVATVTASTEITVGGVEVSLHTHASTRFDNNGVAQVMATAAEEHGVLNLSADTADGNWAFDAGSSGAITGTADNGSGKVRCTDATHGLTDQDWIVLHTGTGDLNFPGAYQITYIDANTFDIVALAYTAGSDTATWEEPSHLVAGAGDDDDYDVTYSISAAKTAGLAETFLTSIYKNATRCDASRQNRYVGSGTVQAGHWGGIGVIAGVAEGDWVWMAVQTAGTVNVTFQYGAMIVARH